MNNYSNNIDKNANGFLNQAAVFFADLWQKIIDFFGSYKWQEIVFVVKFIFIIISLLLIILIIILLLKIITGSTLHKPLISSRRLEPTFNKKKISRKWKKIAKRIESEVEANYKLAVLEADKIFNNIIKEFGYGTEKRLSNIDEIKQASKFKEAVIEDKKLKISKEEAQKTVEAYRKGLEELGAL